MIGFIFIAPFPTAVAAAAPSKGIRAMMRNEKAALDHILFTNK